MIEKFKNNGEALKSIGMLTVLALMLFSCAKSEDRSCFKSNGSYAERFLTLDSIRAFHLNEHIKYRIYQNDYRKLIIKGGGNLINFIEVDNRDNVLYVTNNNKCNFLRDQNEQVEVEIHYPYLNTFYIDATDSVVFANKVRGNSLTVEMRNGGGSLTATVDVHKISMVISHGAGDITLKGIADEAELKVQNNGAMDAAGFHSTYVYMYQNSTADMFIDLDNSSADIQIDGTGNVFYRNNAANIVTWGLGQGTIQKL